MEHEQQLHTMRFDWTASDLASVAQSYKRARQDVLMIEDQPAERLQIQGADRLDLLERLSTNMFKQCRPGDYVRTCLLEANGRLIDVLDVFVLEDELVAATGPGRSAAVADWFKRHIFFQDEVSVEIEDPWPAILNVYGPGAKELLESNFGALPAIQTSQFHALPGVVIQPNHWPDLPGFRIFIRAEEIAGDLRSSENYSRDTASHVAAEALRIEAGLPRRGHEINPGIIPLEAGLSAAISFTKGCYIGQEVIARLESRGELANQLSGVRLSEPATLDSPIAQAGKPIGTLTSLAYSPRHGWIGLAQIKTRRLDRDSGGLTIQGAQLTLEALPFPHAEGRR